MFGQLEITTLNGEGLQHEDGHSQIMAGNVPNCISYDPTFSYELLVIMHDAMTRMFKKQENVFYYITTMNENYSHPGLTRGQEKNIIKGMYLLQKGKKGKVRVQLLGSGAILRESIAAAELLSAEEKTSYQLSSGTLIGDLAVLFGLKSTGIYRALSHIETLKIPEILFKEFVHRNELTEQLKKTHEITQFLQQTWLFGESISSPVKVS